MLRDRYLRFRQFWKFNSPFSKLFLSVCIHFLLCLMTLTIPNLQSHPFTSHLHTQYDAFQYTYQVEYQHYNILIALQHCIYVIFGMKGWLIMIVDCCQDASLFSPLKEMFTLCEVISDRNSSPITMDWDWDRDYTSPVSFLCVMLCQNDYSMIKKCCMRLWKRAMPFQWVNSWS